ncbi:hypothetical protein [Siminovitchia fortis]|nr:hypothetical protein [Siminovitchia fortis]
MKNRPLPGYDEKAPAWSLAGGTNARIWSKSLSVVNGGLDQ